ncbi:hypothetical protein ACTHSI_00480 [Neisseria sp. P0001.S004]|uniref:hypothetical protein n=1 Tax=Neisseria sp. P0001.S005 TaxID=3436649 RepID=UPI003F823C7C
MKVEIDADFSDAIARFESLPEAVGEKLRWAAFQGVSLLREEIKIQAPRHHKRHYFYSKGSRNADGSKRRYDFEPGDLRRSVFAFYDKSDSVDGRRAVYQVGWRDREGSRGRYEGGSLKAVPYGYMVHNGVRRKNGKSIAPRPFLSRALKIQGAKMEAVMLDAVLEVVRGRISD